MVKYNTTEQESKKCKYLTQECQITKIFCIRYNGNYVVSNCLYTSFSA